MDIFGIPVNGISLSAGLIGAGVGWVVRSLTAWNDNRRGMYTDQCRILMCGVGQDGYWDIIPEGSVRPLGAIFRNRLHKAISKAARRAASSKNNGFLHLKGKGQDRMRRDLEVALRGTDMLAAIELLDGVPPKRVPIVFSVSSLKPNGAEEDHDEAADEDVMLDIIVFGKETWKKFVAGDINTHSLRLRPEDTDLFEHVPNKIEAMLRESKAGNGKTIVWETKTEIRSRASV
jgi:hypothetical protein